MADLQPLLSRLTDAAHQRGRQFERVCKWFLEHAPEYKLLLRRVWLWDEWPGRWGVDAGIDLVAETVDGKLWAIQAKAYGPHTSITKRDVDTFLSESARSEFSYRLLIATTDRIGRTAQRTIESQEKHAGRLLLSDLQRFDLDWPESPKRLLGRLTKPKSPKRHQHKAIVDVVKGFDRSDRGQLVMACGTGKTLVGLWVSEKLEAKRTLVLLPSLSLLSQTLRSWATDTQQGFSYLVVCSDETVKSDDHWTSSVSDLGLPATTAPSEIAQFLRRRGRLVVFATYQSTPRLAQASSLRCPQFDLVIADEAHRCTGPTSSAFTTALDPSKIRTKRRLFMTATPRYFTDRVQKAASDVDLEIASMDDQQLYGPVFHRLTFGQAIAQDLLSDYQVLIVGVDEPTYLKWAERAELVTQDGATVTDARTLAAQIALARAMQKHNLRRVISFHSRISRADEFAASLPDVIRWMPRSRRPSGRLWCTHVSGQMPTGKRNALLDRLRGLEEDERGLLANAQCLGEGVDVPALDGVVFVDPRRSQVDVIQAVGRAIRKAPDKSIGTIILPVFIEGDKDQHEALESSAFKPVWQILKALRAHDDEMADQLDAARRHLGRRGSGQAKLPGRIVVDLPRAIGTRFAQAFEVEVVRRTTKKPDLTAAQILEWADAHFLRMGKWPTTESGTVPDDPDENWASINANLRLGLRGLPGESSLAQLLQSQRGVRNHKNLPPLSEERILEWAEAHFQSTGEWPRRKSGPVGESPEETWQAIDTCLGRSGSRGLPGGSSLAKLLELHRGVTNHKNRPALSRDEILAWADDHHEYTGEWPKMHAGVVRAAPGETWGGIQVALSQGKRGLAGRSSLPQLLKERRGVRNDKSLPDLCERDILRWADEHRRRTGEWPKVKAGSIHAASGETWSGVNASLTLGLRGLPCGSSLANLLAGHRAVPNRMNLPDLSIEQILSWADDHKKRTSKWPHAHGGDVLAAPGETWIAIGGSLAAGRRGLPAGSSIARLLAEHRGVRHRDNTPKLSVVQILRWADQHHAKTGTWPTRTSGPVRDVPGETWARINGSLVIGNRGLAGGSSVARLLKERRGVRNISDLPALSVHQILAWADEHKKRTEKWPTSSSGTLHAAPGETWAGVARALGLGSRGLRGGSSLARLLEQHRGTRNLRNLKNLSERKILSWADDHFKRAGKWPTVKSGEVRAEPGETWAAINRMLWVGGRGLEGGSSLSRLIRRERLGT